MSRKLNYLAGMFGILSFFSLATPTYASSLTQAQVSSVVTLLQSFGADSQMMASVEAALNGQILTSPLPCNCPIMPAGSTSGCGCSGSGTTTPPVLPCLTTSSSANLSVGATGPDVTALQQFLGIAATGYFGPLTKAAVSAWQTAHNLPATGYVGPLTRAALVATCGGGGTPVPPTPPQSMSFTASPTSGAAPLAVSFTSSGLSASSTYIINYGDGSSSGSLTVPACTTAGGCILNAMHTYASTGTYTATLSPYIACMYSNPRCMIATVLLGSVTITVGSTSQATLPTIYSITPSSGTVGSTVSVTGFGFTSNNTVLFDGSVAARNVPISSSIAVACTTNSNCHGGIQQTLTFTVPSSIAPNCAAGNACPMYVRLVTPGQYSVSVQNVNGTGGASSFTVTGTVGTTVTPL